MKQKFKVGDFVRIVKNGNIKKEKLEVVKLLEPCDQKENYYFVKRRKGALAEKELIKVNCKPIYKMSDLIK